MRITPLVLLVDDEEIFLEIAAVKLRAQGFDTESAHDAIEAIAKAEALQPDLVLSDIHMPGPNGWDFALELRRNPKTHTIRIAFFTSLNDPWTEVSPEKKEMIIHEIGTIPIFNKATDVGVLGDRVKILLT